MVNNTKLWLESPSVFIMDNGYLNFFPTREMNKTEQINSITLFFIYVLLFSHLLGFNTKILDIILFVLILTLVLLYYGYYSKLDKTNIDKTNLDKTNLDKTDIDVSIRAGSYDSNNELKLGKFYSHEANKTPDVDRSYEDMEKYFKKTQRRPTSDNPLMNPVVSDYNTENIPSASNVDDEDIKNEINVAFNKDLFRDLNDLYDRKNSQRVFYTVPGGSVPNDQDAFAKWCYKLPKTCQEGSGIACLRKYDEDLRYRTSYR
jgi:hypothetical protein